MSSVFWLPQRVEYVDTVLQCFCGLDVTEFFNV